MIKIDMFYLYLGKSQIKLLAAKKSLFSQYSIGTYEKKFQVDLLKNGKPANMDVIASAIKEVVQHITTIKDKQVFLILPEEAFGFIRFDVPGNIAPAAIDSFIKDKLKTEYPQETNGLFYDYFYVESETQKTVSLFTVDMETAAKLQEILRLLDLELVTMIPQSLAYFKVFEKTLRKGKVENILYAQYEKDQLDTMLYDSFGLLEGKEETYKLGGSKTAEQILKQKSADLEKKGKKINRLILSGSISETVRQDTFTKDVGMWTNPLKRILPQFYQEYLKMLITPEAKPFSLLEYDVCFGAFIFSLENRTFSPMKKKYTVNVFAREPYREQRTPVMATTAPSMGTARRRGIPKEIFLFIASFVVSFGLFTIFSKTNLHLSMPSIGKKVEPTAVPTVALPSPTPTPSIQRSDLKIKILNGSGTAGKASEVKDILKGKNYQEIVTGNADNFDYTQTEIAIKKGKNDAKMYLLEDLKDYLSNAKITTLADTETADVVITIGSDFK